MLVSVLSCKFILTECPYDYDHSLGVDAIVTDFLEPMGTDAECLDFQVQVQAPHLEHTIQLSYD